MLYFFNQNAWHSSRHISENATKIHNSLFSKKSKSEEMKSDFERKDIGEAVPEGLKEKKITESLGNKVRVFQLQPFISGIFQIHIYFNILVFLLVCKLLLAPPQSAIPDEAVSGPSNGLQQLHKETF